VWTRQQQYCTACAAIVLLGVLAACLYLDPRVETGLNPFGEDECARYEQQNRQQDHGNPERAILVQPSGQTDYYACRLAAYTRRLAVFTGLLVIATITLGGIGIWQGRILGKNVSVADRAANEARDAILLSQRPRLRVRNFVIRPGSDPVIFWPGSLIGVQFYVVNAGGSPATIRESHCTVYWTQRQLPMERPYEGQSGNNPISPGLKLQPGQSWPGSFQSDELMGPEGYLIRNFDPSWAIYLLGWIEYEDNLGIVRRTAFCRRYGPPSEYIPRGIDAPVPHGRFNVVRDLDYEHEE
jgi:hypothetical protein